MIPIFGQPSLQTKRHPEISSSKDLSGLHVGRISYVEAGTLRVDAWEVQSLQQYQWMPVFQSEMWTVQIALKSVFNQKRYLNFGFVVGKSESKMVVESNVSPYPARYFFEADNSVELLNLARTGLKVPSVLPFRFQLGVDDVQWRTRHLGLQKIDDHEIWFTTKDLINRLQILKSSNHAWIIQLSILLLYR